MINFPRWKSLTVLGALIFGVIFALPNLFGSDPALQVAAKNYEALDEGHRTSVETFLREQNVQVLNSHLDKGRLTVRFGSVAEQLKARDLVNDQLADRYLTALATAPRTPAWLRALGLKPMNLGLDLRGGLYLLYQVDVDAAIGQLVEHLEQDFRRTLREGRIQYTTIEAQGAELRVVLRDAADLQTAQNLLSKANSDLTFEPLAATATLRVQLDPAKIRERQDYAIQQNITTLRNRVNELGVSEPIVQRQGADRIVVQLPGVQNSAEVKDILGKTATLEFRLVDEANSPFEAERTGRAPLGSKLYYRRAENGGKGQPVLLKREVIVTGDELTDATSGPSEDGPAVFLRLESRGAQRMLATTRANLGRAMAVVYIEKSRKTIERDGEQVEVDVTEEEVINVATIRGVFSNSFQITGLRTAEASNLALLLRSGSLVVPVYPVEERAIGPSLGQANVDAGVNALLIGGLLLFAFMAMYYKGFGLIANAVLVFNVVLLVAIMTALQAVLTLPGIAGIVLTVAMAVDANILIYERIREELRNGNSPLNSIETGFEKAFSAIADSNVTGLIAGVVLFLFGTGPIKGFAVTLCVGIVTTLFTAILGSRALIYLIVSRKQPKRLSI